MKYQSVVPEELEPSYDEVIRHDLAQDPGSPEDKAHSDGTSSIKWSVGWKTPALMVVFYLVGLVIAIGHFLFFRFLDGKDVESIIRQSYVATISNLFARAFSLCVGIALGTSYTQLLWRSLRQQFFPIGTIDSMFSMSTGPLNLLHLQNLLKNPILWLTALLLPLVPLATTFPPGALTVTFVPISWTKQMQVPTYSLNYRGTNDSYVNLKNYALFNLGADGPYIDPKPVIERLVKSSFLQGSYLTAESPCGDNCTYQLQIPGPEFVCQDTLYSNLPELMSENYGNTSVGRIFMSNNSNFIAASNKTRATDTGNFALELQWSNGNITSTLACDVWTSEYTLQVSYESKTQSSQVDSVRQHRLNGTYLINTDIFYNDTFDNYPDSFILPQVGVNVSTAFQESNVRAIYDSLVDTMGGGVSYYGFEPQFTVNTDILVSPLVLYNKFYDLYAGPEANFNITANIMQNILQNLVVSLLTIPNTEVSTEVNGVTYTQQYIFTPRRTLIVPYTTALGVSLIFLLLGLNALRRNGVSASSGGFIQILRTTQGSRTLGEVASKASTGGTENIPAELEKLEIMFGKLKGKDGSFAGFGVQGEVTSLVERRHG
ncbi:hypothetical protein N431DRAFT_457224 [Stipitochalara longipes BDJ]|nr:hypothetical protein N431DRAFT_457224 [Stipitochalara longipes BDJ]